MYLVDLIRGEGKITKVELKVVSDTGVKNVVITDAQQLSMFDTALKTAKEVNVNQWKVYPIWADITLYKNNKKIDFFIQEDQNNLWLIDVHNKTFQSDYLFRLIQTIASK